MCKVDFALSGPVPWAARGLRRWPGRCTSAGRGPRWRRPRARSRAGRHPERPYVLAAQPGVVDPSRAPAGQHTLWTYAHVPAGSTLDLGEARDGAGRAVRARASATWSCTGRVVTAAQEEEHNANYVGGDIAAGATTPWQMVMRPVPRWDPYRTPMDGVYLCSASTPPGPAVHGMAGVHAARRALRQVFGDRRDPLELVRDLAVTRS